MLTQSTYTLPNAFRKQGSTPKQGNQCREEQRQAGTHQAQQPRQPQSKTIPLPSSHIPRTKSELQLAEDMHVAEWRDRCMFQRLVCGIRERQRRFQILQQEQEMLERQRGGKLRTMAAAGFCEQTSGAQQTDACVERIVSTTEIRPTEEELCPYESGGSSFAPVETCPPRQPSRQHLQSILHKASGLADEALSNDDWSLGGYEDSQTYPYETMMSNVPTLHQAYFLGPLLPTEIEEDPEMADGEIFSLDI